MECDHLVGRNVRHEAVGVVLHTYPAMRANLAGRMAGFFTSVLARQDKPWLPACSLAALLSAGGFTALPAVADEAMTQTPPPFSLDLFDPPHADGHGMAGDHGMSGDHAMTGDHAPTPAGVFGANMVPAGHFMFAYTPMFMHMDDNYIGSSVISPNTIVSSVRLPQPMTMMGMTFNNYRIVPTSMDVQMHMFHAMYGVTDWLTLMVMATYEHKSMTMTTYKGVMGTTVLGQTTNNSEGFGDTAVTSLWRLYEDPMNHVHLNLGLSLPSGSTTETMTMLSPMNKTMTMRASYGMQLGTGTVDLLPGITYKGHLNQWSWGAAYRGRLALDNNDEGYHYGYRHSLTGWGGYTWLPGLTTTARVAGSIEDRIHGSDALISGLMQGSNPLYYGGKRIDLFGGIELAGAPYGLGNTHLSVEGGGPVYQDLNGPQLGQAWQITAALGIGF
jgi:hypothetical protein